MANVRFSKPRSRRFIAHLLRDHRLSRDTNTTIVDAGGSYVETGYVATGYIVETTNSTSEKYVAAGYIAEGYMQ